MKGNWPGAAPMIKGFSILALFAIFFALNVRASWLTAKYFYMTKDTGVASDHEVVKSFAQSPHYAGSDFIIHCNTPFHQLIATYFSNFGKAYTVGRRYGERVMKDSFDTGDIYISEAVLEDLHRTTDAPKVFENDIYCIFKLEEESLLLFDYSGLYKSQQIELIGEEYAVVRGLAENNVRLEFLAKKDRSAGFQMRFYDPGGPRSVKVYANGEFEGIFPAMGEYIDIKLEDVKLRPGVNDITIEFGGDVSRMSLLTLDFL
jgi:hypothetical protein